MRRRGGARRAEPGLRGEVRLPVRRVRQPPTESGDRADPPRTSRADADGGARDRAGRAGRDRPRPVAEPVTPPRRRVPARVARPAPALAARHRGHRLDRDVLLLRRARQPSASVQGPGGRRRVVGDPRRRLLPHTEVPGRAGEASGAPALVQVGGVHDLVERVRAPRRPLLPRRRHVPRRPRRRRSRHGLGGRHQRWAARSRLDPLRRSLPASGSASASAGDRAPRLRRGGGLRRQQPLQRTRSADPAGGDARDDDGRKRPLRDHPGSTGARAGEAGRTGAGPGAWPSRQAALGAQQLPDAAGRARDDRPALSVPVHARARLARPAHVDGARGLDPSLLQPSPPGSDHLDHPGHRRSSALRTRRCHPTGGRFVSRRRRPGSIRTGRRGRRAALRDVSFRSADGRIVLDGSQGRGPRHPGADQGPGRPRSRSRPWRRRRCRSGT